MPAALTSDEKKRRSAQLWYWRNKARANKNSREYYAKHSEKIKARQRKNYEKTKAALGDEFLEKRRVANRKSYRKHSEQRAVDNKARYADKHEEILSQKKEYYAKRKKEDGIEFVLKARLKTAKERAVHRGYEFSLTLHDLRELYAKQSGRCAISDRVLEIGGRTSGANESQNALSLDRIDASKGYIKTNVRLVVWVVNLALRKWGDAAFISLCDDVVAFQRKRSLSCRSR